MVKAPAILEMDFSTDLTSCSSYFQRGTTRHFLGFSGKPEELETATEFKALAGMCKEIITFGYLDKGAFVDPLEKDRLHGLERIHTTLAGWRNFIDDPLASWLPWQPVENEELLAYSQRSINILACPPVEGDLQDFSECQDPCIVDVLQYVEVTVKARLREIAGTEDDKDETCR